MLISQREAIAEMAGEVLALADGSQLSDAEVCVLVDFLEWIANPDNEYTYEPDESEREAEASFAERFQSCDRVLLD